MTTLFSGIYTASLTPLTSSYEPNLPALVSHVEQLFESGSDGVAILGSTGEANSLTIEQRLDIISYCGRTLAPERLMMGTGSCALQDAIRLTQASIEAGVFSVLVIPPFYYKPQSDESVIRYYSELISSVDDSRLRIIFYNFPKLSGYNFSTEILQELNLDKEDTLNKAQSSEINNQYLDNTDKAYKNGVFGSPTFIYEGEVFWGDDRLDDCIKWIKAN